MLGMPHTVESAPASSQEYSGTQQVNVVPTIAADRQLPGNATGTVTENWMAGELRSGSRAYQVNDRTVVALHTATPLYRDLKVGDRGEDVRSLNDELSRLGYDSVPQSGEYNRNTGNGWRQLMVDAGNSDGAGEDDMNLRLSDTMWIPPDSVKVQGWSATRGSAVQAGAPLGTVPGGLVRLAIRGGKPSDEGRPLTVFGVAAPLGDTGHRPPSKETEETIRNSDHSPEHHLQRHPFQIRNGQGNHSASEWKKNLRIKLA